MQFANDFKPGLPMRRHPQHRGVVTQRPGPRDQFGHAGLARLYAEHPDGERRNLVATLARGGR